MAMIKEEPSSPLNLSEARNRSFDEMNANEFDKSIAQWARLKFRDEMLRIIEKTANNDEVTVLSLCLNFPITKLKIF